MSSKLRWVTVLSLFNLTRSASSWHLSNVIKLCFFFAKKKYTIWDKKGRLLATFCGCGAEDQLRTQPHSAFLEGLNPVDSGRCASYELL